MTQLYIQTDGGSRGNPGLAACAFVVLDGDATVDSSQVTVVYQFKRFLGTQTNNQAEYQAVLASLDWLAGLKALPDHVTWQADSMLIVRQLGGQWQVKDVKMRVLKDLCAKKLEKLFPDKTRYHFEYIPRENNYRADALVNEALDERENGGGLIGSEDFSDRHIAF